MKSPSKENLLRGIGVFVALAGWSLWILTLPFHFQSKKEAFQLKELNEFLLADIRNLKSQNNELIQMAGLGPKIPSGIPADKETLKNRILQDLRTENRFLKEKLDRLHDTFQRQMNDILHARWRPEDTDETLKATLSDKRGSVQLGTLALSEKGATFRPEDAVPQLDTPLPTREGRVVSVDEKDEFVVINLGKKAGVEVGSKFLAKRGDGEIAKLHVIEVRESIAACDIEYLMPGGKLQIDDKIYASK